ncbi:acyltransferase family protein [Candidatus Roizmanbacteria bacterium]|nr:acyltransferase family protein [Candidatus Roizmanbacteria bacterium]
MERNKSIDNLRGLAMFAMMVIHAISYFFSDKFSFYIWDYSQWAVPVFLFCSCYLYFKSPKKLDKLTFFSYLRKRLLRLLIPYYFFLFSFYMLLYFFDIKSFFNFAQLKANIFLYGGLNYNWLVLLFVYFTFLMPFILWLEQYKYFFYGFFFTSFASSIYFIFSPLNYRLIMWLPWSTLIFFTIFFVRNEKNWKKLFLTATAFIIIFFILRVIEIKISHNSTQYANKYPPTLYHLSYGIFSTIFIFWLSKKNFFSYFNFERLLYFLSINSYSLFFIHILVILSLNWLNLKTSHWFTFFLIILGTSSMIQLVLNRFKKLFVII